MSRDEELVKLRLDLARRRDSIVATLQGDLQTLGEIQLDQAELADQAQGLAQGQVTSQMAEVESQELGQINEAISRFSAGEYGKCEGCDAAIPLARLQALPYATLCISCQMKLEESGCRDWSELQQQS